MSQVYILTEPSAPIPFGVGVSRLPLATSMFANGVAVNSTTKTFQFADVGSYTVDLRMQIGGSSTDKKYNVALVNVTTGAVIERFTGIAASNQADSDSYLFGLSVADAAHEFALTIEPFGDGDPADQLSLYILAAYIATTPLAGYVTGGGTPGMVPKWVGLTQLGDSGIQDDGDLVSIYAALFARRTTGFVGVGSNAPVGAEKMRINGDARFEGNISAIRGVPMVWPVANGAGKLTNDGAGNLSWS